MSFYPLFMGLNQVRDLTQRTVEEIICKRPFHSLNDLLIRVDPRPLEARNLVSIGALKNLGNISELLLQLQSGDWRAGQLPLFTADIEKQADWTMEQKITAQESILGISVDVHPLELHLTKILENQAISTIDALSKIGQRVRVAGMLQTWRRGRSKGKDYLYLMSLEDLEGNLDVLISSEVYRRSQIKPSSTQPILVEGVIELNPTRNDHFIRAERIWSLVEN